jgi:IrrE N-terminal-like domain
VEINDASIITDLLPPVGGKWREYERKALEVRRFAGIGISQRLDPFSLAAALKLKVVDLDSIGGLSEESRKHLSESEQWSGGVTQSLPDGSRVVIINQRQSRERQAATLMEEICHTLLGHNPSSISSEKADGRSYNRAVEDEAYGVGAAALLPYRALAEALKRGESVRAIGKHFGVTPSLVEYRIRVLNLFK